MQNSKTINVIYNKCDLGLATAALFHFVLYSRYFPLPLHDPVALTKQSNWSGKKSQRQLMLQNIVKISYPQPVSYTTVYQPHLTNLPKGQSFKYRWHVHTYICLFYTIIARIYTPTASTHLTYSYHTNHHTTCISFNVITSASHILQAVLHHLEN